MRCLKDPGGGYQFGLVAPFLLLHAAVLLVPFAPMSMRTLIWLIATYSVRMFGVTAGYHRYFSHRSYKLGRVSQFLMAFLAQTSGQKSVLWWAAQHREHHRLSDREGDIHSPFQRGFWWSHVGWVLSNEHDSYDPKLVADFARFPELRWLDRYHWIPTVMFAAAVLGLGGVNAFLWGYVLSTVLLYHCTFSINSVAHLFGTRRFDTADYSRNNWLLALITFGEGWHNNHHFSMSSCRHWYRWWELDITWLGLKLLSFFGIARDLRPFRSPSAARQEAVKCASR
jgi:stearoyl-CoA desaturase (Delta-9 desaturase)